KKNDFLRASPITQYSCASHSMAQIDGKPIRCAPEEACNPIAAEIAMRVPAYEPGPRPTIIVSGPPNFAVIALRFSKNRAEFFRSFGHSRVRWVMSSSNHARLPRAVESSSARVLMGFEK